MRVLHFSDIHLEDGFRGVPPTLFANKRFAGYLNLRLRRRKYYRNAAEKIGALARFADAHAVDVALCTGDYTALGTEPEIAHARKVVAPLVRGRTFATVPGNHDVYLPDAVGAFERHFGEGLETDLDDVATDGIWPTVRLLGEYAAVVALNSSRPNPPVFRSSGRIPDPQLGALPAILARDELRGRFVFVMTHYAPRLENGRPDARNHGLENADELLAALPRARWGVLLHGHVHHCYRVEVPESPFPLFGAGSTTMSGREGFWVFDIEPERVTATRGEFHEGAYTLGDTVFEMPRP